MKVTIAACVAAMLAVCAAGAGPAWGTIWMALYADESHSVARVDGTPVYAAEVWIWCLPDSRGMMGAEFGLTYPPNVIPGTITWSSYNARIGDLPGSVSIAFNECKVGWTWIAHQTIYVTTPDYGEARLAPFSSTLPMEVATCELGYPIYPASVLNNISINCQAAIDAAKPLLIEVEAVAPDSLLATFDNSLWSGAQWYLQPHNFRVLSVTDPPETLAVSNAWYGPWQPGLGTPTAWIKLGENLVPGTAYVLEAWNICSNGNVGSCCPCGYCPACTDSELGFTYAPIATMLRDYSVEQLDGAVRVSWELGVADEGISFVPMRLARGASGFEALAVDVVRERALRYGFRDDALAPGESYRYRIDYLAGGERATLFETEWIEPPAERFALHQNAPNPFNPSTRISFELGEPARARLAVYDVSGKLVRGLVDETLGAGAHSAFWDGRTERGEEAASGIYLYKLRAGSFVETKKMVLLR